MALEYSYWTFNSTDLCFEDSCGDLSACDAKGLILPLFLEVTWRREFRALLYFLAMCWTFLGVFIVADVFMCACEKISSKTMIVHIAGASDDSGKN